MVANSALLKVFGGEMTYNELASYAEDINDTTYLKMEWNRNKCFDSQLVRVWFNESEVMNKKYPLNHSCDMFFWLGELEFEADADEAEEEKEEAARQAFQAAEAGAELRRRETLRSEGKDPCYQCDEWFKNETLRWDKDGECGVCEDCYDGEYDNESVSTEPEPDEYIQCFKCNTDYVKDGRDHDEFIFNSEGEKGICSYCYKDEYATDEEDEEDEHVKCEDCECKGDPLHFNRLPKGYYCDDCLTPEKAKKM